MKICRTTLITLFIALSLMTPQISRAQDAGGGLPPKAKAFLLVSGYGAAGGALLGLASMAFGTSSRAVAQGASLGLYAGILFGTYVLVSHHQRTSGSYDNSSPYNDDAGYDGDYGEEPSGDTQGGFFDSSYHQLQLGETLAQAQNYRSLDTKKGSRLPPLSLNFLNFQF